MSVNSIVGITDERYKEFKNEVLNNVFIKRIDISEQKIVVKSSTSVEIEGHTLHVPSYVLYTLFNIAGIKKGAVDALYDYAESFHALNKVLKKNLGKHKITAVYSTKSRELTNFYRTDEKLVSDMNYFHTLELLMNRDKGANLRSIHQESNGDLSATIENPTLEFQYENNVDEIFTTGYTYKNTAIGVESSFFNKRLTCLNGMVTDNDLLTISAKTQEDMPDFMNKILDPTYKNSCIEHFKSKILLAMNTRVSFKELNKVNNVLTNWYPSIDDQINSNLSALNYQEIINQCLGHYGNDVALGDSGRHIRMPLMVYDLVNGITSVSSKLERGALVNSSKNQKVQALGGMIMFKNYDLPQANLIQLFK